MAKNNPFRFSTKDQDDETDLLYYGYRYYNSSTGRWLNRDPMEERGGRNLLAFISNDPVDAIDRLGKQCCLITVSRGPNSVMGHSILACDNGTYVSKSAEGETNPQWRTPQQDYSQDPDIGFPGSTFTTNCIPCVDESKVKLWFENNKASQWSYGNNCANAALDAIEAGLPDPQTKPSCCRPNTYARNLLRELRNGMTPAFATPTYVQGRVDEFNSKNKDCNKWRCTEIPLGEDTTNELHESAYTPSRPFRLPHNGWVPLRPAFRLAGQPQLRHPAVSVRYRTGTVEFERTLDVAGPYHLLITLLGEDLPHNAQGHVPTMIETQFHVLVWTNGQVAVDQDVTRLYVTNGQDDSVDYSLIVFRAPAMATIKCRVQDQGHGEDPG